MTPNPARARTRLLALVAASTALLALAHTQTPREARAGDWPQWRGPNRDGRAADFRAPQTWPKTLKQQWKVNVGDGVATPALVGDKLYVFTREGGNEVLRCLDANTGKEAWAEKYAAAFSGTGDRDFPGPRSSPAVADGKVVTFGVNGTLSCVDATTGKKLWRVETGRPPMFHTSSSPVIADGLVIAQVGSGQGGFGGGGSGGVYAYDLKDGKEKWKWTDEGTAYSSPVLMTVAETKMVVAETDRSVVGLSLDGGKKLWGTPFPLGGGKGGGKGGKGGGGYNASTPMVDGQTLIFSGSNRGTRAFKVEKSGNEFTLKESWNNRDASVIYNTPVLKDGYVYGQSGRDELFCLNATTGKEEWTQPIGGMGGRPGYGNIVDAGSVLVSLTPAGKLRVFQATDKEYKELASYPVGTSTYAYPILTGNRIYIKDQNSVILWTVE